MLAGGILKAGERKKKRRGVAHRGGHLRVEDHGDESSAGRCDLCGN